MDPCFKANRFSRAGPMSSATSGPAYRGHFLQKWPKKEMCLQLPEPRAHHHPMD